MQEGRSYSQENVAFHLAVGRASRNNVLVESLQRLVSQIRGFRQRVTDPIPELPARDVAEHRALLAAIQAGNSRRAQTAMSRHIHTTIRAARLSWTDRAGPPFAANRLPMASRQRRQPAGPAAT